MLPSWLMLLAAIGFEVAGTVCMKLSAGFVKPLPSLLVFVFYGIAFTALTFALREMPVGFAYAIWSGIGTAAITVIGIWVFGESFDYLKATSILLIILGVTGLNLSR